jgi:predicted Ser/Thr protein kinase
MRDMVDSEFLRLQQALAGRYSLERELGRGGMGIVYLAREVSLDRPVALKLLPPHLAAQPAARERFLREARTAAKLSHPNIVPIFTVDEADEFVFFAMAYIDGESLGERVRRRGPRPPSEVAAVLREVAWALGYAHAQGIVHRDIKPDNILIESGSGRALVADFGIASVAQSAEGAEAGKVSGTAEFMSPEQASGTAVGPATDIYSLGVVGFYALSAQLPFTGSTAPAILAKHISEPAPPVASVVPDVPRRLARTIDRCLTKDPSDRFASDEDLADAMTQTLEVRRELPVPLRVFVKRDAGISAGGALLYLWVLGMVSSLAGQLAPTGWGTIVGFGTFIGGLTIVPTGLIMNRARRLLKSGFGPEELVVALKAEIERAREEGAFEFGHGPSLYEKVVRSISAAGLGVALISGIFTFVPGAEGAATVGTVFALSMTTGAGAGVLALVRLQRRHDVDGQLRSWFWRSRLGRAVFRVAGLGLERLPSGGSPTYRPTEFAIGTAADRLFEQLPRPLRRQLADLPDVVRKLETDAQSMRARLEELDGLLAELRSDRAVSRALDAALRPEGGRNVIVEKHELSDDLRAARDATQQRLADAVAALESIRLSLLRMQAGSGDVEGVTADLAAARDVAEEIDHLLEAQRQVEKLLEEA